MLVRAVRAVDVLRAGAGAGVISSELLQMQMRNFVIVPDDCLHSQRFHICVCV